MAEQAYAYVTLIPQAKGFQKEVANQLSGVGGAGGTTGKETGKKFKAGFGGAVKGIAGPLTAALSTVAVGSFIKSTVAQANDLNESLNAVNVTYTKNAEGIKKLGENAAAGLGLSNQEFNQLAVGFTAFSEKIAGEGGNVVGIVDDLTKRGADFASVMNVEVSDALTLFRSGLAGETEPLRRYGVDVSEASVKAFAYANGIAQAGTELTENQKVQARYGTIMEQTSRMQGDFANTSDQLANSQRILKATFKDVQAEVGSALLPILAELSQALIPLVKDLSPVLVEVFDALAPVVTLVTDSMGPLLETIKPLIGLFADLVEVGSEIIASILPILFDLFQMVIPIIIQLSDSFLPLVQKLLPSLIRLVEALMPFIQGLANILSDYIIPLLTTLGNLIGDYVIRVVDLLAGAFELLATVLAPVWDFLKPIVEGLLALAGIKPSELKKTVSVTYKSTGSGVDTSSLAGILAASGPSAMKMPDLGLGAGAGAAGGTSKADAAKAAAETKAKLREYIVSVSDAYKEAQKDYNKLIKEANKDYTKAKLEIAEQYDKAIADATGRRDSDLAGALVDYNKSVADINADSAQRLTDVIQQSMNRLRDAFRSVAEVNIADMFSSDAVNKNVMGLIEGLRTKLTGSRKLLENAALLASQGYSQTFIEQVVSSGAEVGNEMAQGILNATPEQQRELKDLFNVIETEASNGMDALAQTLYEKNGLATQELKNMYQTVLDEQTSSLIAQKALYDQAVADIMVSFNEELATAKTSRDLALVDAETALNEALLKANEAFLEDLGKIETDFKKKIDSMKGMVSGLSGTISALQTKIAGLQTSAKTNITGLQGLIPLANGGLVTGPTPALVGEAGPELVIPLAKFESLAQNMGGGKALNYYAAPNQSIDNEQALFQAMRRAKVVANW